MVTVRSFLVCLLLFTSTTLATAADSTIPDLTDTRLKLLLRYPPFKQRVRDIGLNLNLSSGELTTIIPLMADEVGYLASKNSRIGGLNIDEKLLYSLTCHPVYEIKTPVQRNASGNSYQVLQYNMLGIPITEMNHHIRRTTGKTAGSVRTSQRLELTMEKNGAISFLVRYEFVEPTVFLGPILKNRKLRVIIEEAGLESQLIRAMNQILVLNGVVYKGKLIPHSTIRDGKLVPMRPGYALTPERIMRLTTDANGKVKATLNVSKSSDKKKLKDAHLGQGEFKNVPDIPVGQILPPD